METGRNPSFGPLAPFTLTSTEHLVPESHVCSGTKTACTRKTLPSWCAKTNPAQGEPLHCSSKRVSSLVGGRCLARRASVLQGTCSLAKLSACYKKLRSPCDNSAPLCTARWTTNFTDSRCLQNMRWITVARCDAVPRRVQHTPLLLQHGLLETGSRPAWNVEVAFQQLSACQLHWWGLQVLVRDVVPDEVGHNTVQNQTGTSTVCGCSSFQNRLQLGKTFGTVEFEDRFAKCQCLGTRRASPAQCVPCADRHLKKN